MAPKACYSSTLIMILYIHITSILKKQLASDPLVGGLKIIYIHIYNLRITNDTTLC